MVMSIGWCVWRARGEGGGGWWPTTIDSPTLATPPLAHTHVSPPLPFPPPFSHAQEPLLREQVEDGRAPPASLLPRGLLRAGAAPVRHGLPAPRAQLHIARRAHRGDQVGHRHGEGGARRGGPEEAGGGRGPPAPGMSERGDGGAGRENFWRGTRERHLCDTHSLERAQLRGFKHICAHTECHCPTAARLQPPLPPPVPAPPSPSAAAGQARPSRRGGLERPAAQPPGPRAGRCSAP
jgi:hypothetical protein